MQDTLLTQLERDLLKLMADTHQRRWWDFASLHELLPAYTRNQIISALAGLRRRDLVAPHHRRLGLSDYTITTAGERLLSGDVARGARGWSNR